MLNGACTIQGPASVQASLQLASLEALWVQSLPDVVFLCEAGGLLQLTTRLTTWAVQPSLFTATD